MRYTLLNKNKIREKFGEPVLYELMGLAKTWAATEPEVKQGDRVIMGRYEVEVTRLIYDVVNLALKKVDK